MEGITLGQIGGAVAFLVALFSGLAALHKELKKYISSTMKEPLEKINKSLLNLEERIDKVDAEACKNFLVSVLADIDKMETVDEVEKARFWEQYEHYISAGGNSYIKRKVEQLKAAGKL